MREASPNEFHAVRRTNASREIVAQVRGMIAGGHVKAGDRLPPERELAQLFGVGRSTLREAVRVLESLGLVEVRAGEGTFLAEGDAATTQAQLPPALFSKWTTQVNLFELRTVLEPGLASLAARRATADYLTKMHEALAAQAAQVQRGELGTDEDATFHELIAEATRNPALIHLMQHLARSLRETRDSSLQRDGRPTRSLWENRATWRPSKPENRRWPPAACRRISAVSSEYSSRQTCSPLKCCDPSLQAATGPIPRPSCIQFPPVSITRTHDLTALERQRADRYRPPGARRRPAPEARRASFRGAVFAFCVLKRMGRDSARSHLTMLEPDQVNRMVIRALGLPRRS